MRNLETLPEGNKVVIPCVYNSGRRAYVRATIGHPEVIHISIETDRERPYQRVVDGYLHLDTDRIDRDLQISPDEPVGGYRKKEAEEIAKMAGGINKHYFAGTLLVMSDYPTKMIVDRKIGDETWEVVVPMTETHLGGSWQHYYQDKNWLREAETIKGGQVFIA